MGGGVGRWPMEGGQGGEMGGGHQRAVWEQQKVHWFPLLGSLNWSDLAGDEGGGVGRWPMEGGQGVHWFPFLGSLKNLSTGLIWLVTRVGGWGRRGEVAHGGRARGETGGGAPESSAKGALKNLTTGLIWLVTRVGGWGEVWEVAHGGRARGEMGGATEKSVGATFMHCFPFLGSLKNLTTGLIWLVTRVGGWGGGVGRWPMEGGQGVGAPESIVGAMGHLKT